MEATFKRQLQLILIVQGELEINAHDMEKCAEDHPDFGRRIPLRERAIEPIATPSTLIRDRLTVSVNVSDSGCRVPSTSAEIRAFATSRVALEIPYLKTHLKAAVEDLVSLLREESRLMRLTHEIPEEEFNSELTDEQISDEYLVRHEEHIKKLVSKFETNLRKRLNPLSRKRGKSAFRHARDREIAISRLQNALLRLLADREKITKAAVARELNIGGEKSRTQSLNHWLKEHHLDFAEEVKAAGDGLAE